MRTARSASMSYWTDPALPGLALLRADLSAHRYAPHVHDALVLAVTEAGGSAFFSRGSAQTARPDVVLAFNPMEMHAGRTEQHVQWRYRGFYLESAALLALRAQLGIHVDPGFVENSLADPSLALALTRAHRLFEFGAAEEGLEQLISALGWLIARHAAVLPKKAPGNLPLRVAVEPALRLIDEAYATPLRLQAMAEACDLTPYRLIQAFRAATGMTPHAWLVQTRLRAAARLLRGRTSLVEAAMDAGFCDQSALHKHFVRCFGMTPSAYAAAHRPARSSSRR